MIAIACPWCEDDAPMDPEMLLAAGGASIPAVCDVTIMRDGNASMYLGSPRMAEMVIGEKVTLEEMDGRPLSIKLRDGVARQFTPFL